MHISDFIKKQKFNPSQLQGRRYRSDFNFSFEHNMQVLEETNKETDRREADLDSKVSDAIGNITDILSHYAIHTIDQGKHTSIENYLGRKLAGELFANRLQAKIWRPN